MHAATDSDLHPVMILAGGTGGHIFPGLAVAKALNERNVPVLWLGAEGGMETRLVPQHGIAIDTIAVRGMRGKGIATLLATPFRMVGAVRAAMQTLRERDCRRLPRSGTYPESPSARVARKSPRWHGRSSASPAATARCGCSSSAAARVLAR